MLKKSKTQKMGLIRTNASPESFNSKIKAFRAQLRGVRRTEFFLYRLEKLFA